MNRPPHVAIVAVLFGLLPAALMAQDELTSESRVFQVGSLGADHGILSTEVEALQGGLARSNLC